MFSHIFKGGFLTPFGSHPPNFSVDINNYIYIIIYIYMMMYILIISKPLSRSDWIQSYFSWFVRPPRSRLNSKSWISSLDKTRPNEVHISMDQLNYLQMVCKDHQICPQCDHSAEITTIRSPEISHDPDICVSNHICRGERQKMSATIRGKAGA
jgi:hypothetical protein